MKIIIKRTTLLKIQFGRKKLTVNGGYVNLRMPHFEEK